MHQGSGLLWKGNLTWKLPDSLRTGREAGSRLSPALPHLMKLRDCSYS
jgi:hypothetical protein